MGQLRLWLSVLRYKWNMKLLSDVLLTLGLDNKTQSDTTKMRCVNLLSWSEIWWQVTRLQGWLEIISVYCHKRKWLMCEIWGSHVISYEECRVLECYCACLLPPSSEYVCPGHGNSSVSETPTYIQQSTRLVSQKKVVQATINYFNPVVTSRRTTAPSSAHPTLKEPVYFPLTLILLMWRIGWAHNNARK